MSIATDLIEKYKVEEAGLVALPSTIEEIEDYISNVHWQIAHLVMKDTKGTGGGSVIAKHMAKLGLPKEITKVISSNIQRQIFALINGEAMAKKYKNIMAKAFKEVVKKGK